MVSFLSENPGWLLAVFVLAAALFSFYTYYHKSVLGQFVRALIAADARTPETAKSLSELKIACTPRLSRALSETGALSGVVCAVGERTPRRRRLGRAQGEDSLVRLCFYIPPERQEKAESIYGEETNVFVPIFITAASLIAAAALSFVLPEILALFA